MLLTRETNLYQTDAIKDGVTNASKVATNYLSYNDTDGLTVGYRQSTERAVIKGDGMEVYDENNSQMAQFKAVTRLGYADKGNLQIDYHSLQLFNANGSSAYVHFSDLRDNTGFATVIENFVGDGTTTNFQVHNHISNANWVIYVKINGTETTAYRVGTSYTSAWFYFTNAPANGSQIEIKYKTDNAIRSYTFGSRATDSIVTDNSFVNGWLCTASGLYSHAEGRLCVANGSYSHAEGNSCTASGTYSHAEGSGCTASGESSHAEGTGCMATNFAHADGSSCTAKSYASHAVGYGIIASNTAQFACGKYNVETTTPIFIVGGGDATGGLVTRKNALTLNTNGNMTIAGTLTQSSDKRLKHHRAYLSDQEQDVNEFVNQLKPVWFEKDEQKHLGFYAQDVQQSDKWNCMVDMDTNGYLTLGYTEIIAPLVAYCQNQQKKIEGLEERIARLEQLLNNQ